MKPLTWLITLLLAGNAILLAVLLSRQTPASPTAVPSSAKSGATTASPTSEQTLRHALESGDPAALAAAGLSPEITRSFAAGRAYIKQQERLRALWAKADQAAPHWKRAFHGLDRGSSSTTREMRMEGMRIEREYLNEMHAALGEDPVYNFFGGLRSQLSFLPDATRDQLSRIEKDYGEMMGEIYTEAQGLQLPSDKAKLELLKTEKERDIAALLGPELYQQFIARTSPSSGLVRSRYGSVIRDEAEYQAIFALQKAFDDRFPGGLGSFDSTAQNARRAAQPELDQAIAAVLGSERALEAQRNNNPEYQTLTALSTRLNLPAGTAETLYASRDTYATQSQQILANSALTPTDQAAQLRALADQAQTDFQKSLGAEGTQAYANLSPWLRALKNGNSFSITPSGAITTKAPPAGSPRK